MCRHIELACATRIVLVENPEVAIRIGAIRARRFRSRLRLPTDPASKPQPACRIFCVVFTLGGIILFRDTIHEFRINAKCERLPTPLISKRAHAHDPRLALMSMGRNTGHSSALRITAV